MPTPYLRANFKKLVNNEGLKIHRHGNSFITIIKLKNRKEPVYNTTNYEGTSNIPLALSHIGSKWSPNQLSACRLEIPQDLDNTIKARISSEEIPSSLIGEQVMDALRQIDQIGYVRYASVYRNFSEASDFQKFLGQELDK